MAKSKSRAKASRKIAVRGEKVVKETDRAVPVKPERGQRPVPTVAAAVDRRKQFVGTDEPRGGARGR